MSTATSSNRSRQLSPRQGPMDVHDVRLYPHDTGDRLHRRWTPATLLAVAAHALPHEVLPSFLSRRGLYRRSEAGPRLAIRQRGDIALGAGNTAMPEDLLHKPQILGMGIGPPRQGFAGAMRADLAGEFILPRDALTDAPGLLTTDRASRAIVALDPGEEERDVGIQAAQILDVEHARQALQPGQDVGLGLGKDRQHAATGLAGFAALHVLALDPDFIHHSPV